jgi:hypothetical protein
MKIGIYRAKDQNQKQRQDGHIPGNQTASSGAEQAVVSVSGTMPVPDAAILHADLPALLRL